MVLGDTIAYGTEIQLLHFDSKAFLNAKVLSSEADKSGYKFELNHEYGSGMVFKFLPRFKLRQEGERIEFKDKVLLMNTKLNCYVNFKNDLPILVDRPIKEEVVLKPLVRSPETAKNQETSLRYESFISVEKETIW